MIALPDDPGEAAEQRRGVVVGVEGLSRDDEVMAFAVAEATAGSTALTAVHAWRDVTLEATVGSFGSLVDWSGVEEAERRQLVEAVDPWRDREPDVQIQQAIVLDRPASALIAASTTAELLVVGHRHRGRLARLGSTTHGVLHRTSCPIAVVPIGR